MSSIKIPVLIDAPNFINRILEYGIDKSIVAKQLTINGVCQQLKDDLDNFGFADPFFIVEFVCSNKQFGPQSNKFTQAERDLMLDRIMKEPGVHIEEICLPGTSEKGVDGTVAAMMETFAATFNPIVLISKDRDFVTVMRKMRSKGIHVILVSMSNDTPKELINEAYLMLDYSHEYEYLFAYSYPKYYLEKNFCIEDCRDLISNADDRRHNQLRVDLDGVVYLSHKAIGSQDTYGVQFRFETYGIGNKYVGPKAASDLDYVNRIFNDLTLAWKHKSEIRGFIDVPVKALLKK